MLTPTYSEDSAVLVDDVVDELVEVMVLLLTVLLVVLLDEVVVEDELVEDELVVLDELDVLLVVGVDCDEEVEVEDIVVGDVAEVPQATLKLVSSVVRADGTSLKVPVPFWEVIVICWTEPPNPPIGRV